MIVVVVRFCLCISDGARLVRYFILSYLALPLFLQIVSSPPTYSCISAVGFRLPFAASYHSIDYFMLPCHGSRDFQLLITFLLVFLVGTPSATLLALL